MNRLERLVLRRRAIAREFDMRLESWMRIERNAMSLQTGRQCALQILQRVRRRMHACKGDTLLPKVPGAVYDQRNAFPRKLRKKHMQRRQQVSRLLAEECQLVMLVGLCGMAALEFGLQAHEICAHGIVGP